MIRNWLQTISQIISTPQHRRLSRKASTRRGAVLNVERLEDRETPSATITSTANSINILVPGSETAVLNISGGKYTVTDSAGVTGTGGTIVNDTFTASSPASGQAGFSVDPSSTGTVQLGAANVIPSTTTVTVGAGTLDLNGLAEAISALDGAGTVTSSASPSTAQLTIGSNIGGGTFSGSISETVGGALIALIKTGSGTETFSGTNAYTGGTTINEGVLSVDSASSVGSALVMINTGGTLAAGPTYGSGIDQNFLGLINTASTGVVALGADSANPLNFSGFSSLSLGAIPGSGAMTQNTFTYSGVLTPNGSTYLLGGGGGTLTVSSALTDVTPGDAVVVGLNGTLIGSVILTGANTYTGATTITSGAVLQIGNGGTSGSIADSNVIDNGNLTFNDSGPYTVAQSISGIGSVTQAGIGTTTLSVADSYTGGTSINAGVLSVSADNQLGSAPANPTPGNIVINSGTLLATTGFTLNTNRGIAIGNASGGTGEIDVAAGQTLTFNGVVANDIRASELNVGSGTNTGTLVLGGVNTYSGVTSINAGTLSVSFDMNLGAAPGGATAGDLVINSGATLLATSSFTLNSNRGIGLGSGGEIDAAAGQTLSFSGIVANGSLVVGSGAHTGTLVLGGVNTYSGPTTIDDGTLSVGAEANLGVNTSSIVINGGTLFANASFSTGRPVDIGPTSGSGGGEIDVAAGQTFVVGGTATIANIVSTGNTAIATISGTNPFVVGELMTVAGATNTSYNGTFTVESVTSNTITYGGISANLPNTTGGTITAGPVANTGLVANNGSLGTGALTVGSGGNTGTLVLVGGANSYSGGTTVNAGALRIGADNNLGATAGNVVINGGTLLSVGTFSSPRGVALGGTSSHGEIDVAAGQTLTLTGTVSNNGGTDSLFVGSGTNTGTLVLNQLAAYTGSTTVNAGTLELNSAQGGGTLASGSVTLNSGATLAAGPTYGAIDQTFLGQIALGSVGVAALGAASVNPLSFSGYSGLSLGAIGAFTYSGALTPNGTTYQLGGGGGTLTIANALTGASDALVVESTGTVILSALGTYGGGTTVIGGTLELNSAEGGGMLPAGSVTVDAGATLAAGPGYGTIDQTFLSQVAISSAGTVALGASSNNPLSFTGYSSLSLGAIGSFTYGGALTSNGTAYLLGGGGGVLTVGSSLIDVTGTALGVSGSVILTGSGNTYSGATTINPNGSLQLGSAGTTGLIPNTASVIDNGALIFDVTGAVSFTQAISGSGIVAKISTGTTTLGNSNSYTGSTTVAAGVLSIGADASLGTAPSVNAPADLVLTGGGTLLATGTFALNPNRGVVLGPVPSVITAMSWLNNVVTITLSSPSTLFTGEQVTIANSTPTGYNGTFTITVLSSTQFTFALTTNPGTYTSGATFTGSGEIDVTTGQTLTFGTTYQIASVSEFGTTVTATTSGANALSVGSSVTIAGVTGLNSTGYNGVFIITSVGVGGPNNFTYTSVAGLTTPLTGLIGATASVGAIRNNGASAGNLTLDSTTNNNLGAIVLGGINPYTGTTTINGGDIQAGSSQPLGHLSAVTLANSAKFDLEGNNVSISTLTGSSATTVDNGGATSAVLTTFTTGTAVPTTTTFAGLLQDGGAGSFGLTVTGNPTTTQKGGVLALTGLSNSYTGVTTITGIGGSATDVGTLQVTSDHELGSTTSPGQIIIGGGVLYASTGFTLGSNRSIGVGLANYAYGEVDVATGQTLTYGGIISTNAGTAGLYVGGLSYVITNHLGTFALTSSSINTYTGPTRINAGYLSIAADANLGPAPTSFTNNWLTITGAPGSTTAGGLIASATFTLNSNRGIGLGSIIGGSNTSGGGAPHGDIEVANGFVMSYGGTINNFHSGTNNLTVNSLAADTGTLALTGTGVNFYTGTTTVDNGLLSIVSDGNLGVAPATAANNLILTSGGLLANGTFTLNAKRQVVLGIPPGTTGAGSGHGTIDVATGQTLTVGGVIVTGASSGAGTASLIVGAGSTTAGTLVTSATANYGGITTINSGVMLINSVLNVGIGLVTINSGGTFAAGPTYSSGIDQTFISLINTSSNGVVALDADSSNSLNFTGYASLSLGALPGSGVANPNTFTYSGTLTPNGTTYRLGGGGGTLSVANALTSTDSLIVGLNGTATGTVILDGLGTNNTTVNGGALELNSLEGSGTLTPGSVTVNAGATLVAGPGYGSIDQTFLGQVASGSAGVVALGADSNNSLSFTGYSSLTLGAISGSGVANPNSFTYSGALTPNGTTYLLGGGGGTLTVSGTLTSGDSLIVGLNGTPAGTVVLNSFTSFSTTAVNGGALEFNAAGDESSGTVTVSSGATVAAGSGYGAIDQSFLSQFAGSSAGVVALGADSSNSLNFSGLSSLSLGAIAGSGVLNPGAFTYSGTLTPNGTNYILGGGGGTLTVASALNNVGDGLVVGLNGTSLGAVILTGTNTYGGVTTISAGTTLQLGNGGLGGSIGASASITDNGTLTFDESGMNTVAEAISGNGSITQAGSGSTILGASNSYTGGTIINMGTVSIGADSSLGTVPSTPTAGNLVINGGTLLATGSFTLNGNRGIALGPTTGSGAGAIDVAAGQTLSYVGIIASNGANGTGDLTVGSLVPNGATGTLALGGGTIGGSTYTGTTTIYAGVLSIVSDNNLGTDPGSFTPGDIVIDGGVLLGAANTGITATRGILIGPSSGNGSGEIDVVAGKQFDYYGVIANNNPGGTDSLIVGSGANSGQLVLGSGTTSNTSNNTYTGSTIVNAGQLQISQDANLGADPSSPTPGNLIINSGASVLLQAGTIVNINRGIAIGPSSGSGSGDVEVGGNGANPATINGVIASNGNGADGLSVNAEPQGFGTNTGTLVLAGINTYTGSTSIAAGAVQVASSQPLGVNTALNVSGGATLELEGYNVSVNSLTGNGVVSNAGEFISAIANMVWSSGTVTVTLPNASTLLTGQQVAINGVSPAGYDSTVSPYTITVVNSTTFTYLLATNPGTYVTGFGFVIGGGAPPANAVLTVGGLGANTTFSGTLSNGLAGTSLSLAVTGGDLILSGRNTYTGSTTVLAGKLTVNGSASSTSWASVYDGAVLGGSGTLSAEVDNNGQLTPGGTAQFTTGKLYFGNGTGSYNVVLNGATPGNGYDQVVVTSPAGVDLNSSPTLNVTLNFTPAGGTQFDIVEETAGGSVQGHFNGLPEGQTFTVGSQMFSITYLGGASGHDIVLTAMGPPSLAGLPVVNASSAAFNIVSATANGATATITTSMPHGFWVGELVTLTGTSPGGPGGLAGTFTVTAVPSATTFQFASTFSGTGTLSSATVTASLAGVQRSMVDSIVYNFTEPVNLTTAAFSISVVVDNTTTGNKVGVQPTLNVAPVPFTNEWVVTFSDPVNNSVFGKSIANGAYSISINPALVTAVSGGENLTSGETDTFYRLYGDVTGVQSVKNVDANAFNRAWGNFYYTANFNAALDYNDDGKYTNIDANAFNRAFNTRYQVTTTI